MAPRDQRAGADAGGWRIAPASFAANLGVSGRGCGTSRSRRGRGGAEAVLASAYPARVFTGLVEQTGRVAAVHRVEFGLSLEIDPGGWAYAPANGDSIAVDGCCLTVAGVSDSGGGRRFRFDVIRQSLEVTTLGELAEGALVNLEACATPTTLLGGHLVQGHVDGVGEVLSVMRDPTQWRLRIEPPLSLRPLVVDKGSIAVAGVSLTVAAVEPVDRPSWFEVALIPTTLAKTNLAERREGDRVNLESDCIVRAVAHLLRWQRG